MAADKLNILGTEFEFVGDDKNRINLFEKNDKLLIGGIDIFNELHIFLADTGSKEKLQAWIDRLTSLEALNPEIVIPSHADLNASFDKKALSATKEYLQKAIEFTKASSRSEELAASLKTAYPDYINTGVIDLGAKVLLGEIQWGMIMLKLIASNHIKKDQLEKFTALAKELIMKSRAEEGNLSYSINVSLDDPCLFTFVEVWRDQKAFDIHNRTPHFTDIFPQIQAMSDKATPPTFYTELDA